MSKDLALTLKIPPVLDTKADANSLFNNNGEQLLLPSSSPTTSASSSHDFLERLAEIMNDPAVRSFFNDYFKTWSDGQACLMLMHAYNLIDEAYARKHGGARLSSDQIVPLVRGAVSNANCRKVLCNAMQRYIADDVSVFANILQETILQETIEQPPSTQ